MKNVEVSMDGLSLTLSGDKKNERLNVAGEYPGRAYASFLFSQLGLMHLVAHDLPSAVATNFWVAPQIQNLIKAMYAWEGGKTPAIHAPKKPFALPRLKTSPGKVAISYSGGKDSVWNLWRAIEKYGKENVLVVHIHGLNKANSKDEFEYTLRQQKKYGFRIYK